MTRPRAARADVLFILALLLCLTAASCTRAEEQPAAGQTAAGAHAGVDIGFRTEPDPLKAGDNAIEVTVTGPDGAPLTDATVTAVFSMPAMPSMNMPAMRSSADLAHQASGLYRGTGRLSMGGTWTVTVTVSRGAEELARKTFSVVAKS